MVLHNRTDDISIQFLVVQEASAMSASDKVWFLNGIPDNAFRNVVRCHPFPSVGGDEDVHT